MGQTGSRRLGLDAGHARNTHTQLRTIATHGVWHHWADEPARRESRILHLTHTVLPDHIAGAGTLLLWSKALADRQCVQSAGLQHRARCTSTAFWSAGDVYAH